MTPVVHMVVFSLPELRYRLRTRCIGCNEPLNCLYRKLGLTMPVVP